MTEVIYLTGFMGSGKSTTGALLAGVLNRTFIDLDRYIEKEYKKPVAGLFNEAGEDGFRQIEGEVLRRVSAMRGVVVATGGGTPCFGSNMDLMNRTGLTIYMQLPYSELYRRLLSGKSTRPLIASKSDAELLAFIETMLKEREPFYKKAAIIADAAVAGIDDYVSAVKGYCNIP